MSKQGEVSYIEPPAETPTKLNEDTSKACWMIRSELKQCLMESDCMLKHGKTARECMSSNDLSESCQNIKYTYYLCRRSILDMRSRFRGRKGEVG